MIRRPKPGEDEDLPIQEEFLKEKSKNQKLQPAAQFVNLRRTEPAKRSSTAVGGTADAGTRKQSKYAQSIGLKNHAEKRPKTELSTSLMVVDILEKNIEQSPPEKEEDDDKVYFPKVIPKLLGNIVEKNVDSPVGFDFEPMPAAGFPVVRCDDSTKVEKKITKVTYQDNPVSMDIDETASTSNSEDKIPNIPPKSFMVTSEEADKIHSENIKIISKMSEKEILEEQQKILSTLDPKLVEFIKATRKQSEESKVSKENLVEEMYIQETPAESTTIDKDTLWENDVLSNPNVHKWLDFDSLQKDKFQWMKGIKESQKIKPDEPYEARFNFNGYLLPYTIEYTEETKTLFHHGEEPHRLGYSMSELFELLSSTVIQQQVMALNTIAGILEYHSAGTYKDVIELPLNKIFFVIRIALDENKVIFLESALKAMRNLVYNRIDEASLDALLGFEEGSQQPSLENDKSEIEELESKESEIEELESKESEIEELESKESEIEELESKESEIEELESKESEKEELESKESEIEELESKESEIEELQSKESEIEELQSKESEIEELQSKESEIEELESKESEIEELESKECEIEELESKESEIEELESKESEIEELEYKESETEELESKGSEIEELESKESELIDFNLAEIDFIAILLRTDILQRFFYILDTVRPSFNCVQYSLQILTRLARDSVETATKIVETEHLMQSIVQNFLPQTRINFAFHPQIVYNGKPILAAVRLLRILALQSWEIGNILITKYNILSPISEYVSSGVDGTYGLRLQIEATCLLSNLLQYNLGTENAMSLCPIIVTTLYKHVQGTDVFINSSIISATHAAVILQFVNKVLNSNIANLDNIKHQIYPLIKDGVKKWLTQLAVSESYTCGHLRSVCAALDCCKSMILAERLPLKFLNDSLKFLSMSRGFKEILKNLVPSSNLLSGIDSQDLHLTKNLMTLGGAVIDSTQKVLPLLKVTSPLPFLASLFNLLTQINDKDISNVFLENISFYLKRLTERAPSLCDNWFTRMETELVVAVIRVSTQNEVSESVKDLIYAVANKLCYILRIDKKIELEYLFNNIVFNKQWFTAERLLKTVSLSDADGFTKALTSIDDIRLCYSKVVNLNYKAEGPNIVLRKWQEPILPRDWIYLPILSLYNRSQEIKKLLFEQYKSIHFSQEIENQSYKVAEKHAAKVFPLVAAEKELIITCSLEWIRFNELCFPDLLSDISLTDRFCRIMCVFLCDDSLFLDKKIKVLLQKCTQILFKKGSDFNFDQQLIGLNNFYDFYTQFLEQFTSVSYGDGDHNFTACVLVPAAQHHNVKWRYLLWADYVATGSLMTFDCPEEMLCYKLDDYLYPVETLSHFL